MKRKIALVVLVVLLFLAAVAVYVAVPVAKDLSAARSALVGSSATLDANGLEQAVRHVEAAERRLDAIPARALRLVPVLRQNLTALHAVAATTRPVLGTALELRRRFGRARLINEGAVDIDFLARLKPAVEAEVNALERLQEDVGGARSGWLAPPAWDALDQLLATSENFHNDAAGILRLLGLSRAILGDPRPRRYLVVLLNNAELRGAGGFPSAIGTISFSKGRIGLGRFHYIGELARPPYQRVPAPRDFRRRFARYWADRTFWLNTTFSPDVPDVAVVAARLFRAQTGIRTDGVLFVDARGLATFLPPDASLTVPGTGTVLSAANLAEYVYYRQYEEFGGPDPQRPDALLELGRAAFRHVVEQGFGGEERLRDLARAVAAGHIRFVPLLAQERAALEAVDASGELPSPRGDTRVVTVQNMGGDKLDYWARREIEHRCDATEETAYCLNRVTVANVVPGRVPDYVRGGRDGTARSFLEIYIPASAKVTGIDRDGEAVEHFAQQEEGHVALGFYLEIPRGAKTTVSVSYELALEDGYAFTLVPQPLAHDAHVSIRVALPKGWDGSGEVPASGGVASYEGPLDQPLTFEARASDRTGIPAVWERLVRFWREPAF